MKSLTVDVKHKKYDIILDHGLLDHLHDFFDTNQKIFIITDKNIPQVWIDKIVSQCPNSMVHKVHGGEESKSIETFKECLQACLDFHMSRKDMILAVGGGVIGDLSGYVASSYMRGIKFISIPTTTLSQIDSSIGGKVAINLGHVKNIVGAFYHPEKVLIDFDVLTTLPSRQVINGLIEALKAGLIHDESLFALFEKENWQDYLEEIIYKSLCMKKWVVEEDEKEMGVRKTLNFGHTIGHGIEAYYNLETYLHGECVAMGMLYFLGEDIKPRVLDIYKKLGIQATADINIQQVYELTTMDKKASGDKVSVVKVDKIGKGYVEDIPLQEILHILERGAL